MEHQAKLAFTSWTIQYGQRLAVSPKRNYGHSEVTSYVEAKRKAQPSENNYE